MKIRGLALMSHNRHFNTPEISRRIGKRFFLAAVLVLCAENIAFCATEIDRVVEEGSKLLNTGHPADAVSLLQNKSKTLPPSAPIHFQIGNGYSDMQNYRAAINEYTEALRIDQKLAAAVLNTAYAYVNAHQYEQSLPWFERYINENPMATNLAEAKSQMLAAQSAKASNERKFFDAKQMMEQAVRENQNSPTMHFKLASACEELGDIAHAVDEYKVALQLNPKYSAAAFNIAGCYQTEGRPLDAVTWFQKYLQMDPNAEDRRTVENLIAKLQEKVSENRTDPHTDDYFNSVKENGKFYRWSKDKLPLKVYIDNGASIAADFRESYRKGLLEALDQWSQASQGKIKFSVIPDASKADIVWDWTKDFYDVRQNKSDVEQGVCFMQGISNKHSGESFIGKATVRICILDRESQKPLSDDDMKKTCLHELGHALGLRGHSSNNHDIMFYSVAPTVWPVLSKRDKATLLHLYEGYPTERAAVAAPYQ